MVQFIGVSITTERGEMFMFQTLKLFDEFRKAIWQDHPEKWNLVIESFAQNNMERAAVQRFDLPEKSLEGACLIFGTKEETADRLMTPHARLILSDPTATASLDLSVSSKTVTSGVRRGQDHYSHTYPIKEALIPPETDLVTQYHNFSRNYRTVTEGIHTMIYER